MHFTRGGSRPVLAIALVVLLRRAGGAAPTHGLGAGRGLGHLVVLLATAWLVPWYAIWLLPLAAVARCRRLMVATVLLCAYMLVIAVPL